MEELETNTWKQRRKMSDVAWEELKQWNAWRDMIGSVWMLRKGTSMCHGFHITDGDQKLARQNIYDQRNHRYSVEWTQRKVFSYYVVWIFQKEIENITIVFYLFHSYFTSIEILNYIYTCIGNEIKHWSILERLDISYTYWSYWNGVDPMKFSSSMKIIKSVTKREEKWNEAAELRKNSFADIISCE